MKIHAAARLLANADEAQARRYIEHLTGVKVGDKYSDNPDHIAFKTTWQEANKARKALKATLPGVPKGTASSRFADSYYADETKTRIITVSTLSDVNGFYGLISLIDKNHHEDFMQRLLRLQAEGRKGMR